MINGNANKQLLITAKPPKSFRIEKIMTDTLILETILRPNLIKPSGGIYDITNTQKWQPSFTIQIITEDSYITYYGCIINEYTININADNQYVLETIEFLPHFSEIGEDIPILDYFGDSDNIVFTPVFDVVHTEETGLVLSNLTIKFDFKYNASYIQQKGWVSYLTDVGVNFKQSMIPNKFTDFVELLQLNTPQKYMNLTINLEILGKKIVFKNFHKKRRRKY